MAYIHASLSDNKFVHMKFEDEFVNIICKVNPEYESFETYERSKKVLYVLILMAIYGMIKVALLWYDFFSTKIYGLWFKLNSY